MKFSKKKVGFFFNVAFIASLELMAILLPQLLSARMCCRVCLF